MLATFAKIRERLKDRSKQTAGDLPQMKARAAKLSAEIQNLVDVMANTPAAQAGHLLAAMNERHLEHQALTTRINAIETGPGVIALEVRRREAESRKLLADLRRAAQLEPAKARKLLVRVFDGKLTARPVDTESGPRFQLEGTASWKRMTTLDALGG